MTTDHHLDRVPVVGLLTAALLLAGLAGCSSDTPSAQPLSPAPEVTSAPATTPTVTTPPPPTTAPKPRPTAPPLSRFEADPAVKGMRVFLMASAQAINARNLKLPALLASGTARRTQLNARAYAEDLGGYLPGPFPTTPLGVTAVAPTEKRIPACTLSQGWTLTKKGGPPRAARKVDGVLVTMLLQGGVWKVNSAIVDTTIRCAGVALPEQRIL